MILVRTMPGAAIFSALVLLWLSQTGCAGGKGAAGDGGDGDAPDAADGNGGDDLGDSGDGGGGADGSDGGDIADPCAGHCGNSRQDCGESGIDCGGECAACGDPCAGHCGNSRQDCGESGIDCGGECPACGDPCAGHCGNSRQDCGETGIDCGGAGCGPCDGSDDAAIAGHTLPARMTADATVWATVSVENTGTNTWYRDGLQGYKLGYVGDDSNPFIPAPGQNRVLLQVGQTVAPGASVTFNVGLRAPSAPGTYTARFQMVLEGRHWFGQIASQEVEVSQGPVTGCRFPQGVPEQDFTGHTGTDATIADAVNAVMASLSGCDVGSRCPISGTGTAEEVCQQWFDAVTQALRDQGFCAGQHEEGVTDEIAVSNTGCAGNWYGYHICNYGGPLVVWNPGAQRNFWTIDPRWCQ